MTTAQLNKGKELSDLIVSLESNLQSWERSTGFRDQLILKIIAANGSTIGDYINNDYIDFNMLKKATIAKIKKQIEESKLEFESL